MKWGMSSTLPANHSYNTNGGWSIGRDETADSLSTNFYGIGGKESATHSANLSTDNQWHHIVSTYDGGNRKVYLDGTEVSSASASGSVASTTASLILGASDFNSTAGTFAVAGHSGIKLDEVRFYSTGLSLSQVSALYNFGKGDIGNIGEFSTLPVKISGNVGTSLTQTITAAFANPYYEAVNLTPGLSINSATGEISGTPTVGGVGSITVIARNAAGKRAVTTIPYDSSTTGPTISFPTLSPSTDHALVVGEITHSGGEENIVDLIWGTNATLIGTQFSDLATLSSSTTYSYQSYLPNGSDLLLWLDADDNTTITHSSNAVSQWNDKSGNEHHATASSGEEPTTGSATINGKNVLTWSLGKKMNKSTPTGANWQDIYVVGRWTGGSTFDNVPGIFGGTTSSNSDNGVVGGNNSGTGLWFSNWTDNFYLNGSSNNGSNVVGTMSSPFLISFSKK